MKYKTGIYCLDYCSLNRKTQICCPSHPETNEDKIIFKGKKTFNACIHLDDDGFCMIYDSRPEICREYICEKIYKKGLEF